MKNDRLDDVRRKALDRIDASRKAALRFLIAAGIFEGIAFLAILFLMD